MSRVNAILSLARFYLYPQKYLLMPDRPQDNDCIAVGGISSGSPKSAV
jgi:hypothetical protein